MRSRFRGTAALFLGLHLVTADPSFAQAPPPEPRDIQLLDPGAGVYLDDEHFGCKVALNGHNAVTTLDNIPLVYAYRRDPSTRVWTESQQIAIPAQPGAEFTCHDLAISGDTLLISVGTQILIYQDNGSQWIPNGTVAGSSRIQFAFNGTRLLVPGLTTTQVFLRNSSGWALEATLPATGIPRLAPDFATVGLKVFLRSGSRWRLQQTLAPWDGHTNIQFGTSIAVSSDRIAVGAPGEQSFPSPFPGLYDGPFGAVYVFRRSNNHWVPEQKLVTSADLTEYQSLGTAVVIEGQTIVAGAGGMNTRTDPIPGRIFGFSFHGNGWAEEFRFGHGNGSGARNSLALHGGTLLSSAPGVSFPFSRGPLAFTDLTRPPEITGVIAQPVLRGHQLLVNASSANTGGFKIRHINYSIDSGPYTPTAPFDGSFDSPTEGGVSKTLTLTRGTHRICAFAIDGMGNRGTKQCSNHQIR
jgi:hypothetical protein